MTVPRRIILDLDEQDWDTIQAEFSRRQGGLRMSDGTLVSVPDGESNLAGAMLAEIVRDLNEYRDLFNSQRKT